MDIGEKRTFLISNIKNSNIMHIIKDVLVSFIEELSDYDIDFIYNNISKQISQRARHDIGL